MTYFAYFQLKLCRFRYQRSVSRKKGNKILSLNSHLILVTTQSLY